VTADRGQHLEARRVVPNSAQVRPQPLSTTVAQLDSRSYNCSAMVLCGTAQLVAQLQSNEAGRGSGRGGR
jgi:hypothetical protein